MTDPFPAQIVNNPEDPDEDDGVSESISGEESGMNATFNPVPSVHLDSPFNQGLIADRDQVLAFMNRPKGLFENDDEQSTHFTETVRESTQQIITRYQNNF